MITFDVLTLKAFIQEQEDFFNGARISKIQQPTRREFILTLRNKGETRPFYINISPEFYHICFMSKENAQKRLLEIPQKPPMFCMLLRKYLENSRIAKINQPKNERILEIFIETYNELGDSIYFCLAIELMGKYSNVILYNADTDVIIGCAHNVGAEKSREREIFGGIPYIYPPKQSKLDILNYDGEINYDKLSENFYMFSKHFANLCYGKDLLTLRKYVQVKNTTPCISKDYKNYSLYSELLPNATKFDSVNEMIDEYYAYHIAKNKFKTLKSQYKAITKQKLKKTDKSIKQMEYKLLSDSDSDKFRLFGDLLMANLYNLQDFSKIANVFDYENNKEIEIMLDETKSIKENANKFYKLYTKAKTAKQKLNELIENLSAEKLNLEQIIYSLETSVNIAELMEISSEIIEKQENKKNVKKEKKVIEISSIETEDGSRIYIGKNNKQNDYIVSKLSNDEDLWFHVHNCAGSHILLKSQNITDELILKCAQLAKQYSTAKESTKAGVIYTKRKYLRKPPAAALGYVTYKNEKEIIV